MASNTISDTYDDNSACQKSSQIIEVTEPNIINIQIKINFHLSF